MVLCCAKPRTQIERTNRDLSKIYTILCLVCFFLAVELWGHFHTNSLSLLADAIHLFVDVIGFVISIVALKLTKKKENSRMNFGYDRLEVIGALFSIFFIWVATGYLILEAYNRYLNPQEIKEKVFFVISIVGFLVNMICLVYLHNHSHAHSSEKTGFNIRATYVHVVGDLIQSIGIILASVVIFFKPDYIMVDIICTVTFAILVLITTVFVVKDIVHILSEGLPDGIDHETVKASLNSIKGVKQVLNLKLWSISANKHAGMTTLLIKDPHTVYYEKVLRDAKSLLNNTYNLDVISVQIETTSTYDKNFTPSEASIL